MAPPRPFRRVYRDFRCFEFDPAKSEEVFEARGFDLAFVARIFPGYVLEREDTRQYREARYQVLGELHGTVYVVIYTCRGNACRLITAWVADADEVAIWNVYHE